MNIAILGTRGIPNRYGGYERLAERLALGLAKRGHQLTVYSPHNHNYQKPIWNNINIVHVEDGEFKLGSLGRFIYNYSCLKDLRTKQFDVVIQLDYTTLSIFGFLFPKETLAVSLIDGISGKLARHGKVMKRYLAFAEKMAVKYSDLLITDALPVRKHILTKYGKTSMYIPFGSDKPHTYNQIILDNFQLTAHGYNLLIGTLIPENKVEDVLDGVVLADKKMPFLVVGNDVSDYALQLKEKYKNFKDIRFVGAIYENQDLNSLRYYSNLCFYNNHTYTANLGLFDAMACESLIVANKNKVNKQLLGKDGYYFSDPYEVAKHIIKRKKADAKAGECIKRNLIKIEEKYNWDRVIDNYEACFLQQQNNPLVHTQIESIES